MCGLRILDVNIGPQRVVIYCDLGETACPTERQCQSTSDRSVKVVLADHHYYDKLLLTNELIYMVDAFQS